MGSMTRRGLIGAGVTGAAVVTGAAGAEASGRPRRGRVVDATAWSEALGEDIRFHAYLPAGYGHGRQRYAAAYLMHGRGDDWDAWTRIAPQLDRMIGAGVVPPVILVMPDAPWSDGGSWYVDSAFTGTPPGRPVRTALTEDLVRHVDAAFRTRADRAHRVVGGYSMGGAGALEHLLARPDLFSGGLVLSPALYDPLPPADSSAREFGAYGEGDVPFVDAVYAQHTAATLLAGYDASLPVRLFLAVGDDEWPNPLPEDALHDLDQETALIHNRAKRVEGVSSQLRVLDGGHDWPVWEPAFVEGLPYVLGVAEAGLP